MKKLSRKNPVFVGAVCFVLSLVSIGFVLWSNLSDTGDGSQPNFAELYGELPEGFMPSHAGALPNFSVINDVKLKKRVFFGFLQPMVNSENRRVLRLRHKVAALQDKTSLSRAELKFLLATAIQYKVAKAEATWEPAMFEALLIRLDVVPVSLALAQAASESAWGTSRFATEANNLFGQWCFSLGCGLVPKFRDPDKHHEVAKFNTVQASVNAYIHNLNTGLAYQELRQIRQGLRQQNQTITGDQLALGLIKYSERGAEYVSEIQSMIRINKLLDYDTGIDSTQG